MKLKRPKLDEERFVVERSRKTYIVMCRICECWQRVIGQRLADRFVAKHVHDQPSA